MIVSEDQVATAIAYLNDDEIAAKARYDATMAENKSKEIFARLFLSYNDGPVAERQSRATCNPEYLEALQSEAKASAALEKHKSKVRACEMICEIFRTENANARAAERYAR